MKDTILLSFGFVAGILCTIAFGYKVQAFLVSLSQKFIAKLTGK